jgi:hypothetical protein
VTTFRGAPQDPVDAGLRYRAADDTIEIIDGPRVLASVKAALLAQGMAPDPKAAAVGIERFLTFREWQVQVTGRVIFHGAVEEALHLLPRS